MIFRFSTFDVTLTVNPQQVAFCMHIFFIFVIPSKKREKNLASPPQNNVPLFCHPSDTFIVNLLSVCDSHRSPAQIARYQSVFGSFVECNGQNETTTREKVARQGGKDTMEAWHVESEYSIATCTTPSRSHNQLIYRNINVKARARVTHCCMPI